MSELVRVIKLSYSSGILNEIETSLFLAPDNRRESTALLTRKQDSVLQIRRSKNTEEYLHESQRR
jgi:hypothetical protein